MAIIGYARVSTDGQSLQAQTEALHSAGCGRVYSEKQSGAYTDRPQLAKAIAALAEGDCLGASIRGHTSAVASQRIIELNADNGIVGARLDGSVMTTRSASRASTFGRGL
jgi:hypothetical protein